MDESKSDIHRYTLNSVNHCISVILADTDIRLIVKTTAQYVISADTDIRLIVKSTAQSVISADTDIRPILKSTA